MWRKMAIVCAIATMACGAPGAAQGDERARVDRACEGAHLIAVDEAARRRAIKVIRCLVNRERALHNVRKLRGSKRLRRAAARHSAAMVSRGYFGHRTPQGDDVRQRARRTGYVRPQRSALLGETLAWGSGPLASPAELVASFMSSTPHRRTMLSSRYRDLGIGLALGAPTPVVDAAATLTLNFGRRD